MDRDIKKNAVSDAALTLVYDSREGNRPEKQDRVESKILSPLGILTYLSDSNQVDVVTGLQKKIISSITGFDFKEDEFQVVNDSDLLAVLRAGVELGKIVGKDEAAREENN